MAEPRPAKERPQSPTPATSMPLAEETLESPGIVSTIPYTGEIGDTLVIYCTDPRFRQQTHELLHEYLGLRNPLVITVPGGVSLFLPLVGMAFKPMKPLLDLIVRMLKPRRIVCVAHEDCAAYHQAGSKNPVLNAIIHGTREAVHDIQHRHLRNARSTFHVWYPGIAVEVYYADIAPEAGDGSRHVVFTKIS